jgi:ATP-dependent DNA ligase
VVIDPETEGGIHRPAEPAGRSVIPPVPQPGWLYELKFDGYRLMAGVNDGQVQLATRNRVDATGWLPEVSVLDERGVSDWLRPRGVLLL